MAGNETVAKAYCTNCGAAISNSARFCRACGAAQSPLEVDAAATPDANETPDAAATLVQPATEVKPARLPLPPPPPAAFPQALPPLPPPPPPPPVGAYPRAHGRAGASPATLLAIAGGAGMILMVIYAIVYYPLHYHYSVNFGESLQFGDLLAVGSGVVAIAVGIAAMRQPSRNAAFNSFLLAVAGAPTLVLTILWAFPETFHLTDYPTPFYSGFVYFAQFGQAHIGSGYVQVPLAVSSAAIVLAGLLMAAGAPRTAPQSPWQ